MSNRKEMKFAIESVEVVREKIKHSKTIEEALEIIDQDLETAKSTLEELKISEKIDLNSDFYEKISVKLPTPIMNLLRDAQSITGDTPEQDLEYAIIDSVRARVDSGQFFPTRKDLADKYNLNPIFKTILDCTVE